MTDVVMPFVVGFAAGAAVAWQVSKYLERFRRARRDFFVAKAGIWTLVEMMFRRGWDAARWATAGALVVAGLVVLVTLRGK